MDGGDTHHIILCAQNAWHLGVYPRGSDKKGVAGEGVPDSVLDYSG